MIKKVLIILMTATLSLSILAGCSGTAGGSTPSGGNVQESTPDALAQILERGEIVIAMEGTWAPWTYHDESDTLVGFDVEIAQAIADKLGVTATFAEAEWDSIFAGLDAGRYDIVVNGVEITEERKEKYDFSMPYAAIGTVVIVRSDDDRIASMEDLEGMQTANTLTSTYASIAESYGATPVAVDAFYQSIELLLTGRVDATLNDDVTFYDYMSTRPDANLKIAVTAPNKSLIGIPMRKGDEYQSLHLAINEALNELAAEGVLTDISLKYFGIDVTAS